MVNPYLLQLAGTAAYKAGQYAYGKYKARKAPVRRQANAIGRRGRGRYRQALRGAGKMKVISRTVDCVMQNDGTTGGVMRLWNQASGSQTILPLAYNGGVFTGTPSINSSGTKYNFTGAMAFSLQDALINGASVSGLTGANFTSFFDRYKLAGVAWKVTCLTDTFEGPNSTNNVQMPSLYWRYDYDSAAVPPSLQDIKDDMGVKFRQFNIRRGNTIKGFIKPCYLLIAQSDPTTGQTASRPTRGYLDCTQNTIPHYGMKWALTDVYCPANAPSISFRWEFKYYFSLRDLQL